MDRNETISNILSSLSNMLPAAQDPPCDGGYLPGEQEGATVTLADGVSYSQVCVDYLFSGISFQELAGDKPIRGHFYPYSQVRSIIQDF